MSQIKFKKRTTAQGRNGTTICTGVNLVLYPRLDESNVSFPTVSINPVNSYGDTTNCWIEIPLENVNELIKHLISLRDDHSTKTKRVSGQQ